MQELSPKQSVWQVVSQIPKGKVASYGQIAGLIGNPGAARFVGTTLGQLPEGTKLPWHRVINSAGKISRPLNSESFHRQRDRLLAEGVEVSEAGRIAVKVYGWEI